MTSTFKIVNAVLIVVALVMSARAGWMMLTGKPEMTELFSKWGIGRPAVMLFGVLSIGSALLLLHPKTYVWGNYFILAMILVIIVHYTHDKNLKGVLMELPFFLLSLVIVWMPHPLEK
jgi:hypothetical protein